MKYQVLLTGGKTIVVDEKTAHTIKSYWNKDQSMKVDAGKSTIDTKSIKAILEIPEENTEALNKKMVVDHSQWLTECVKMASDPIEEKIHREVFTRILPGFKLSKAKCSTDLLADLQELIRQFFEQYPYYPRCPMWVYRHLIKDHIVGANNMVSNWWVFVQRNDEAIDVWVKNSRLMPIAR